MTLGATGEGHVLECPRIPVSRVMDLLPARFIEALEQNQKIASCCRHPENHEISAFRSSASEPFPDIYKFHCTCGRTHARFMCGGGEERPHWR